jgi:hypothetical protein
VELELANAAERQRERRYERARRARRERAVLSARRRAARLHRRIALGVVAVLVAYCGCAGLVVLIVVLALPWGFGR